MITDILIILDRSGSMQTGQRDHEGGLRSFITDQKSLDGDVRVTFVQFDTTDPCEIVYDRKPIRDIAVKNITLIPRGGTPLFDAIGKATAHLEEKQKTDPADTTICLIVTDGENNASREWTKAQVKSRIETLEKRWSILFLGANVDAFAEADNIGVPTAMAANYNPRTQGSVGAAYNIFSNKVAAVRMMRSSGITGQSVFSALSFTSADYEDIDNGNTVAFDAGAKTIATTTGTTTPTVTVTTTGETKE